MATINLTNHLYVTDHYELYYTVDADPTEFNTQIKVPEGSLTEAQLQERLEQAYTFIQTGVDFNYVVPVPAENPAPSQAQLDVNAKALEVDAALAARQEADYRTKKAEEIALRIGRTETYNSDATALTAQKADLTTYTTTAAADYKTANDDYDTKRAELEVLKDLL